MAILDLLQLAAGAGQFLTRQPSRAGVRAGAGRVSPNRVALAGTAAVATANHWTPGAGVAGVLLAAAVLAAPVITIAAITLVVRSFRTTGLLTFISESAAHGRSAVSDDHHD